MPIIVSTYLFDQTNRTSKVTKGRNILWPVFPCCHFIGVYEWGTTLPTNLACQISCCHKVCEGELFSAYYHGDGGQLRKWLVPQNAKQSLRLWANKRDQHTHTHSASKFSTLVHYQTDISTYQLDILHYTASRCWDVDQLAHPKEQKHNTTVQASKFNRILYWCFYK